jgi:hypothetical protein
MGKARKTTSREAPSNLNLEYGALHEDGTQASSLPTNLLGSISLPDIAHEKIHQIKFTRCASNGGLTNKFKIIKIKPGSKPIQIQEKDKKLLKETMEDKKNMRKYMEDLGMKSTKYTDALIIRFSEMDIEVHPKS